MFLKANFITVQGTNCINKGGTHHKNHCDTSDVSSV